MAERRAAVAVGEEAVALARAVGDDFVLSIALNNLGGVMHLLGEPERAKVYCEQGLEMCRRTGHPSGIAFSLCNLAEMTLLEGSTDRAGAMYAEAREIATAIGDKRQLELALGGLGPVAYREGRWEEAAMRSRESLRLAQELGMKLPAVNEVVCLAGVAEATGDTARAARLAAAAAFHLPLVAAHGPDDAYCREILESVQAACDPAVWERASAEARVMTLDEAADYALSSADPAG